MAMVEVDENELFANRRLAGLVQSMLKNPKSRQKILEAQKEFDPNVVIPEIDAQKPVQDAVASMQKTVSDFIDSQKKERAEEKRASEQRAFLNKFESGRQSLRDMGVTDEGLKAVEALMEKAGVVDHEIGWAAFSKLNPEPEPAPPAPNFGFRGLFGDASKNPDEFLKSMHASRGMDESALDKRIHEVVTEVRQQNGVPNQQRRTFGR